jgi:hypothetical protein
MSDPALLWNYRPTISVRVRRPPEPIWTMRRQGRQTDCVLLGQGEYGWDLQLLRDGDSFYARRWTLKAEALAEGDDIRRELERDGWKLTR